LWRPQGEPAKYPPLLCGATRDFYDAGKGHQPSEVVWINPICSAALDQALHAS
jgi:hypothetical protein